MAKTAGSAIGARIGIAREGRAGVVLVAGSETSAGAGASLGEAEDCQMMVYCSVRVSPCRRIGE